MRASDADRDRVAAILGEALAAGRLTSTEHADRLDAAYAAVTIGDLIPLIKDLPATAGTGAPAVPESHEISAVLSKIIRGGRWVTGRRTVLRAVFGALIVDLSDAVIPGRELTLELNAFCGKIILTVPPHARVIDEGGAFCSKRTVIADAGSDGTLIRVTGVPRFSKVIVHRASGR